MTPPNSFKESWKEAFSLLRSCCPQIWPFHHPRAPPCWPLLEVKIEVWILGLSLTKGKFQAASPHWKRFSLWVPQKVLGRRFWWSGGPRREVPSEGPKPNHGPPWTWAGPEEAQETIGWAVEAGTSSCHLYIACPHHPCPLPVPTLCKPSAQQQWCTHSTHRQYTPGTLSLSLSK